MEYVMLLNHFGLMCLIFVFISSDNAHLREPYSYDFVFAIKKKVFLRSGINRPISVKLGKMVDNFYCLLWYQFERMILTFQGQSFMRM